MKHETKMLLAILGFILFIILLMCLLLWVSSMMAARYGFTAGMVAIFLPIGALAVAMMIQLVRQSKR